MSMTEHLIAVFKHGLAIASALQVESIQGEEREERERESEGEEHFLTSFLVGLVRRLSVGARLELAWGPAWGPSQGLREPGRNQTSPDKSE